MSRVSKPFRALFLSKSSKSIWHLARRNVFLPDLQADDMSEAAYASLVFERNCMVSTLLVRQGSRSLKAGEIEILRRSSYSSLPLTGLRQRTRFDCRLLHPRPLVSQVQEGQVRDCPSSPSAEN